MSDKRISQLVARVTLANNDVFPIVASGAATTNKVTLQTIDDYMQTNLDFGVTSVAMSVPTGLSVTGSPITSTGTFVVTFTAGYSIPTTAKQTQWDTAYTNRITSATAPLGIASNIISITQSGAASNGYLSSTDWNTFNNKQATITTGNLTESTSSVLTITGGTSSVLGSGTTIQVKQASGSQNGFISSTDWTTFNGKQNALGGTGIVKSVGGTISYLTDSTSNWDAAYNDKINSAAVTGTTTKTLTLTQQDGGTILATWTDDNTDAVTSVFSRTGAVVANSGDYNTSQVTENTNLYYTDTRARASNSFVAGSGAYNSTTGVITIPTNNNQITNGANYITLTSLSGTTGISYNNTTGVITSTITQYTDALARAAFSESVTGLDYNSTTGVLSTATGYSIPSTASQTNWTAAYDDTITSAAVTGTTTKTLTLTQRDSGTITASWTDDNTDAVTSVFGRTGAVVATSGDYTTTQVTEGTNLYYTQARFDTAFGLKSTTNLTEGTNLYYTEARVNANTNVAANTAARHNAVTIGTANGLSLSTQALSLALASTSATGALSSTDWNTFNGKQAAGNYVTTDTDQTITGRKTLNVNGAAASLTINNSNTSNEAGVRQTALYTDKLRFGVSFANTSNGIIASNGADTGLAFMTHNTTNGWVERFILGSDGNATFTSSITGSSFIKTNGTSSQFLKADGSVDSSTYLTTGSASSTYLPLAGGTLTGALGGTSATFSGAIIGASFATNTSGYYSRLEFAGGTKISQYTPDYETTDSMKFVINGGSTSTTGNAFIFQTQTGNTTPASVLTISKTGAATFTKNILVSTANPDIEAIKINATTGTNASAITFSNTSGNFFIGKDTSTGNRISGVAYANSVWAENAYPLVFGVNNAQVLSIVSGGAATFSSNVTANGVYYVPVTSYFICGSAGYRFNNSTDAFNNLIVHDNGNTSTRGVATASSFVKSGGTSSQYLMADGSVTTGGGGSYLPLSGGTLTGNLYMQSSGNPSQLLAKGTNTEFWVDSAYGGGTARAFINRNTTGNQATLMFTTGVSVTNGTAWSGGGVDWSMGMTNDSTSNFYIGYGDIYSAGNRKLTLASTGVATFSNRITASNSAAGAATISASNANTTDDAAISNLNFDGNRLRLGVLSSDSAYGCIGTNGGSTGLAFVTHNGSSWGERMRIFPSGNVNITGNVGIGVGASSRTLSVEGTSSTLFLHKTNNVSGSYLNIWQLGGSETNASSSYYMFCDTDNIGIRAVIYGNGNMANVNNSYGAYSDIKLKENIVDATPKLANLLKVKIRNYNLIGEETKQIGVIAQELEEIFPSMIEESNDTIKNENGERIENGEKTKAIKYSVFVPILIKAMQEQNEIITSLQEQINELKNK